MSTKTSTLVVKVISDASQAQRELADTASRVEGFQKKLVSAAVGLFAVDKIMSGVKAVVSAASDMEQAIGGTDAVFKSSAASIHKWASDTTDSVRLPAAEYEKLATLIGAQLKNAGTSMDALAPATKNLMQLGADLAATFGTDVATAIGAISSALKGEMDPIEQFGITLTDQVVQAKKAEMGLDGLTGAADRNATAQARLAVIWEQSADAQGAAARESESFQAKMDGFKEKFTNLAAVVGGPLIDGFGDLLDKMGESTSILEPIGTAIADVIRVIAQLPGPVLLAAGALAGMALIGPSIVSALAAIGPAVTTAMFAMGKLAAFFTTPWGLAIAATLLIAGAAFVAYTAHVKEAEEAMKVTESGANRFLKVLMAWGSGEQLRQAGMSEMADQFDDLGKSVSDVAREIGVSVPKMITGIMGQTTIGNEVLAAFDNRIKELQGTAQTLGGKVKVRVLPQDSQETIAWLEAARAKYAALMTSLASARKSFDEYNKAVAEGTLTEEQAKQHTEDLKESLKSMQEWAKFEFESGEGNQALVRLKNDMDAAARAADIFDAKMNESLGRSVDYERTTLSWADGIRSVGDAFKTASDAGELNKEALTNWDIGALAATESGSALASSLLDQSRGYSDYVTQAYSATLATSTAADAQGRQADAVAAAGVAADQARGDFMSMAQAQGLTADEAAALADKLGIVDAQHIDNKIFEIIAEDQKAAITMKLWDAVVLNPKTQKYEAQVPAAAELAALMNGVIDGTVPNPIPVTPEVQDPPTQEGNSPASTAAAGGDPAPTTVEVQPQVTDPATPPNPAGAAAATGAPQTGGEVTVPTTVTPPPATPGPAGEAAATGASTTGGTVTVPVTAPAIPDISAGLADIESRNVTVLVTADTTQAWSATSLFKSAAEAVSPVVRIKGDNAEAITAVRNVTTGRYDTTVFVKGDNVQAIQSIRSVTTGQYEAMVRVQGDNSGAITSIRNITTGFYSATVHITGDASAFYSVWNSLPTSRSITVTVNQVQGSVVPQAAPTPPPPGLMARGLAAPSVSAFGAPRSAASSSSNVNVVVNAGFGADGDDIARKLKRVLVDRDRRTGGIVVGSMRSRVGGQ